jgi:hypothetical protein
MNVQFKHECSSLTGALGISDKRGKELDAHVLFSIVDCAAMSEELFDDGEAPANLSTKTGVMERYLEKAENDHEGLYMVWFHGCSNEKFKTESLETKLFQMSIGMLYDKCSRDEDKFVSKFAELTTED